MKANRKIAGRGSNGVAGRWLRSILVLALAVILAAACGGDGAGSDDDGDTGAVGIETDADTPSPDGDEETTDDAEAATEDDDGDASGGRIGFAWTNTAFDVFAPIELGALEAAAERGYELLISNNGGDVAQQLADVETWVGQGVEAITILPLDPAATERVAQDALDAGIVVVGYGNQIPGNQGYITFDNDQGAELLGNAAAEWINDTLGGSAEVAVLTNDTQETARERIDGALAQIESQTDAEVVARQDAVGSADALPVVQSMLVANPNLNVVLCVADDGCLGAAQAFEEAGRDPADVYLAGWDGSRLVLEAIQEGGFIKATAALDLFNIGRAVVEVPANVIEGSGETELNMEYVLADQSVPDTVQRLIDAYGDA